MKHYVALLFRQVAPGHVGPYAHVPGQIFHKRPHQRLPGRHRPLVDGKRIVRHDGGEIDLPDLAGAIAAGAGALGIEGQLLRARSEETLPTLRADQFAPRGHVQRRIKVMPVGAAMGGQAGVHEPKRIQKLGHGPEGGADPRDARALVQSQGRRNVAHVVDLSPRGLGHAAPRVGGERLQVAPGTLGVNHAQRQRRFAAAGNAGYADDLPQRDIHVDVLQIVLSRPADLYRPGLCDLTAHNA